MGHYKTFDLEVSLDDWDDEDLLDEIRNRGIPIDAAENPEEANDLLCEIWRLRRNGCEYDHLMDKFLSDTLGVVI